MNVIVTEGQWQTVRLSVCADCRYAVDYGASELADTNEGWPEAFAAGIERETAEGWDIHGDCPEECDEGFSWTPCDLCRLDLGGDRHGATLMRKVPS